MKKFLSYLMTAMLAMLVMTSCNKDNNDPTPDPVQTEKGFVYGIVGNDVFASGIKSVEFTYTLPGETTKTETVKFKELSDGNYAAVLEKYTSKSGDFSVKITCTLADDIKENEEPVDIVFGTVRDYGEKGHLSVDYQLGGYRGVQPGHLKEIFEKTIMKLVNSEYTGKF